MPDRECLAIGWTEADLDAAEVDIAGYLVRATGVGLLRVPSAKSGRGVSAWSRCSGGR
jgi:hypothetical protein